MKSPYKNEGTSHIAQHVMSNFIAYPTVIDIWGNDYTDTLTS